MEEEKFVCSAVSFTSPETKLKFHCCYLLVFCLSFCRIVDMVLYLYGCNNSCNNT